jgi:hypothetical protein
MAGRSAISIDDLRHKLTAYCASNKEYSLEESDGRFLITKKDGTSIAMGLKGGKIDCSDPDFQMAIADFNAGMGPVPAIIEEDATKILALMKQVPGYDAEITVGMIANLVHCPNATADDLMMLAVTAKNIGANPFKPGEIFLIKPDNPDKPNAKPYIVVGQTFFAKKLQEAPGFKKAIRGIIVENKEGAISYREGKFYNPNKETLVGGWSEIHYDNREPTREEVTLSEYIGTGPNWKIRPATMISKVAFCHAAREAEPGIFGGCYGSEEMDVRIKVDRSKEVPIDEGDVVIRGET